MGGSSSKASKRRSKSSHVECDVTSEISRSALANSEGAKGGKKKAKKGNVKISKEAKKRKSDKGSKRSRSGSSHVSDSIIFLDNQEPHSPVYRKKSSCPSCDAKEIYKASNRGRSGSEKSLRYSDFNKVQRKTRIYDWELAPVSIPLYGVPEPSPEDTCYVCGVYTGRLVRTCHVCLRSFHDGCLTKIGHGLSEAARALLQRNAWSCHQCVSLNHLLTQEEIKAVVEIFDQLDLDREKITPQSYMTYCQASQEQSDKSCSLDQLETCAYRFQAVDVNNSGTISWNQFLNLESVRILQHRCKDALVRLLTHAELSGLRKMFQKVDPEQTGLAATRSLDELLDSEKKTGHCYYPEDCKMYSEKELDRMVSWSDFLRDRTIYVLAQRVNLGTVGQNDDEVFEDGLMTPSLESLEGLEPAPPRKVTGSSTDQLSSLDISTSILEDLTTELDRRCSESADGDRKSISDTPKHSDDCPGLIDLRTTPTTTKGTIGEGHGQTVQSNQPIKDHVPTLPHKGPIRNRENLPNTPKPAPPLTRPPLRRSGCIDVPGYRNSDTIPSDLQSKAKVVGLPGRQIKCKSMQLGQAYGGLVEKMQPKEWKC